jgi:nicotinate (nicotinamide) nucleotide adenylyltransferase
VLFLNRATRKPASLGILPGSFNPLTRAHLALAEAALAVVDEVVLILPTTFPHKTFEGADFEQRTAMLAAVDRHPRLAAATSQGGLFLEIAEECRAAYGQDTALAFVCGRDAAERVVSWPYDDPGSVQRMLRAFELLVASREGRYQPPEHLRDRVRQLELPTAFSEISATEVRRRNRQGRAWEDLVPEAIVPLVRRIYRPLE